jgi:hypothetical protein
VAAEARPPAIGWQEAVARLAAERTRAEACAGLLRRYGDEAAKAQGQVAYSEAKAEVDGVIAGLTVALARRAEPASLPDLEGRLGREVTRLDAVCARAEAAAPQEAGAKGGVLAEIATGAVKPLIEAVQALWLDARHASAENDRLTAKTIQTQLEAATWPKFGDVPPAP